MGESKKSIFTVGARPNKKPLKWKPNNIVLPLIKVPKYFSILVKQHLKSSQPFWKSFTQQ